ncbi:MAG: 5-hydroxyisourate hydrolase [Rhizobiales bacterium]|nr:5-hydroxyisourate hydrolase [Hyphomicrobiales bacterium]
MATLTTHTLDGSNGTHAGGVGVRLFRLDSSGARTALFERETDAGGRLSVEVEIPSGHESSTYELVFASGRYFDHRQVPGHRIMREIVLRFVMPDPACHYHLPIILSPNSCSAWWSS